MSNVTLAADPETWIRAAFSSSYDDEVYIFFGKEYVLINYADADIISGPESIHDGFLSLADTFFSETGINGAFRSRGGDGNQAFIFCGSLCALWDFAPHTKGDKIVKGPMTIGQMFPFFKGTEFETGIDAAFESSRKDEAYLFKGKKYARINYNSEYAKLFYIRDITPGFPSLKKTIFEDGIGAAFASHTENEAYLFKGNSYARFNFAPGTKDDQIIGGVKKILPNWPSLKDILPLKNQGLDARPLRPQATLDDTLDEL